jgi:copper(I)-binding protein
MRAIFLVTALLLPLTAALAQPGGIEVQQAWARATPGALKSGAAYFTIANHGAEPDRLLSVSSPVAESATLHEEKMEDGMMKMRPLTSVTIAPGKSFALKPGGDHLMLDGLKQPLKEGDHFPLILTFEKAGSQQVEVAVGKAAAMGPPGGATGAMDMGHGAMDPMNMTR